MDQLARPLFAFVIAPLLLIVGLQFALIIGHSDFPPRNGVALAIAIVAALSCIPSLARRVTEWLDRWRHPTLRRRLLIAVVIAIVAAVLLYLQAVQQQRSFSLTYQDEFSYAIQARMIAHGRLWMPAHPLADFFDSFQFIATPIYGSVYFPGAALLFAPGAWLHLPFWVMPIALSGLAVALLYLIVCELFDGIAALLVATMMESLSIFRLISVKELAQAPTLFLALAMIACWLAWRRKLHHRTGWSIAIGAAAGWCAITRPVDAMIAALPVGVAMLIELLREPRPLDEAPRRRFPTIAWTMLMIFLGAAPFLVLQAVFNHRVTGSWTETPFTYFAKLCYPQTEYGFHPFDPSIRPASTLPQKQWFYDNHTVPFLQKHTPAKAIDAWLHEYGRTTIQNDTPQVLMMVLFPLGLIGLMRRGRWAVFAMLPLFVLFYLPYVFFLTHYTLISAAAVIVLILAGAETVERTFPRFRASVAMFLVGSLAVLSVSELTWFHRTWIDEMFRAPELETIDQSLAALASGGERAIVLFRFDRQNGNGHIEPVYNVDVIWPDEAAVIRAHDLGERNAELFDYYATTQPDRVVYRFDRATGSLQRLGRVDGLSKRL